jgi:hypothetical protein
LESLTKTVVDGIVSNVKAVPLVRTHITYSASAFADPTLW